VGPIRVAAMIAAVIVIATHLLPEAFHTLGFRALAGFAAGIAIPSLAEAVSAALARRNAPATDVTAERPHGHGHGHGHAHGHGDAHGATHPGSLAALEIG